MSIPVSELRVAGPLEMCTPQWFESFCESLSLDKYKAGLDHARHYRDVAIFQPYRSHGKDLLALLLACEQDGLVIDISGISNYWPGATFRIAIFRPEDAAQFHEYVAMTEEADDVFVPMEEALIN